MTNMNGLGIDLQFLLNEAESAMKSNSEAIVLDYIYNNLNNVVKKYALITIQQLIYLGWLI